MGRFARTLEIFADMVKVGDTVILGTGTRVTVAEAKTDDNGVVSLWFDGWRTPYTAYFDEYVAVAAE